MGIVSETHEEQLDILAKKHNDELLDVRRQLSSAYENLTNTQERSTQQNKIIQILRKEIRAANMANRLLFHRLKEERLPKTAADSLAECWSFYCDEYADKQSEEEFLLWVKACLGSPVPVLEKETT